MSLQKVSSLSAPPPPQKKKNIGGLEPNTLLNPHAMLDSDSAIVSCETIMQIKKGSIRRPLHGYRDRVAVWHQVTNSPTRVEISAIIYTIIISKTEVNFTLLLRYFLLLKGNFKCTYLWNSLSTCFGRV